MTTELFAVRCCHHFMMSATKFITIDEMSNGILRQMKLCVKLSYKYSIA